jgi:hypothetical protein
MGEIDKFIAWSAQIGQGTGESAEAVIERAIGMHERAHKWSMDLREKAPHYVVADQKTGRKHRIDIGEW